MWWCLKRFLLVVALALQSLGVVVLWMRLFDLNVSRPSWQAAIIRWLVPAVWITSIYADLVQAAGNGESCNLLHTHGLQIPNSSHR